ncbi:MAG: VIT1/CCC1 transporter family protein [Candidatus Omnitrophica bacterium]|nr:VIT1/CCC1 transporter family protein [Candidatus Omnitrophota bacterium]
MVTQELKKKLLAVQKNEITEHLVYQKLAAIVKKSSHADILRRISKEELAHYEYFKKMTGQDVTPDNAKAFFYVLVSRVMGLNFGLKLMERDEHLAGDVYIEMKQSFPTIVDIAADEKKHERELVDLIDEERLKYISSVILGLNDALVELTAALAGFTLAIQNVRLIGMLGLITGIAAAMSMAASEYLATKHEEQDKDPVKASLYTGVSYIVAVIVLVTPYFFLSNIFVCLALAIGLALLAISVFIYYTSVSQGLNFRERFIEMAVLSLSIATITFLVGMAARKVFGVSL